MASGMLDATCPKCRKRFGWQGKVTDRPPCPGCGHTLPAAELQAQQQQLEEMFSRLATPAHEQCPGDRRQLRIDAGLSLGQAAGIVGCQVRNLTAWEQGDDAALSLEQLGQVEVVYGITTD